MGILDLANRFLERKNAELEVQLEELERQAALRELARLAEEERIYEENKRRRQIPCMFDNGITEQEFADIAIKSSRHIKRVTDVHTYGPLVYGTVISQSGASEWEFELDFNDYGHITGQYWIDSDNKDSDIPFIMATYITKYMELLKTDKISYNYQEVPIEITTEIEREESPNRNEDKMFVTFKLWRGGKILINADDIIKVEDRYGDFTGTEYSLIRYMEKGKETFIEVEETIEQVAEKLNNAIKMANR